MSGKLRSSTGMKAQDYVAKYIEEKSGVILSTATLGLHKPDLTFKFSKKNSDSNYAEVKSSTGFKEVLLFTVIVTREKYKKTSLEDSVNLIYLNKLVKIFTGNKFNNLENFIDDVREKKGKNAAGFIGDEGVPPSGKLSKSETSDFFFLPKDEFIKQMRSFWKQHRDNYFFIVDQSKYKMIGFSTSSTSKKFFNMELQPITKNHIKGIVFDTGGKPKGIGTGKLKVAVKLLLKIPSNKNIINI